MSAPRARAAPAVPDERDERDERERASADMMRAIAATPTAFEFYQLVRLLSRLHPLRARLGRWSDPSAEVARISASTSLGFPASEVQSLTIPADFGERSVPARMLVNFFGLTGPQGVLPHVYSEHASSRARDKDTAFRDFLDLFNHRAISLLFRAWEKNNAAVAHESGTEDHLFQHLLDLAGMGTAGLQNRLPIRDEAVAFFSGLLSVRSRPADGLGRLVGDYFGVPAIVEQFVGEWRRLDTGGQCALGEEGNAGRLGFGVIGDAVWDPQARVRVRLGPLSREQFDAFVPGGSAHEALCALARLYADDMVGVDAQLVLMRREVRPCILDVPTSARGAAMGAAGGASRGPGLGRGTWLASRPMERDPDETTLRLS